MLLESISSTRELIERILLDYALPSLKIGLNQIEAVLTNYLEKARIGLPIVGYHFAFPGEYLSCFDCVPVCLEASGYFLATLLLHGVEKFYDLIGNWGHPFHVCSAQKFPMSCTLEDLFKFDAIITPTAPCDSTCASYPFFKYQGKFPLIIADLPYRSDKNGYQYYANQLKLSLSNLGKEIGQEPNYNKLKEALELENQINNLQLEIFDLIKKIPSPIENIYNAASAAVAIVIPGTAEKYEFYKETLAIAKNRYEKSQHYSGVEKIRSIWPYMLTFFDISLCEWLDRELGMSILFDIFNYNFSDPINTHSGLDAMFYGMAKRGMGWPMIKQSIDLYYPFIEQCVRFAKEFNADCFIFTQSLACKQFGSVPQLLREALKDEVGIPMLIIDFDVGDARMTSLSTMKEKISMFVQTLL